MMSEFHFIHPWRLLGLILCAALYFFAISQRSVWQKIMEKPFARALIIGRSKRITQILPWVCALGVIGLAGPSWQKELPAALKPESNVMVILQQNLSMYAQDLTPSRHQRVQHKIMSLMNQMPGTRFGLVVYRSGAWLATPLTQDPAFYALFLDAQNPSIMPDGEGSALKQAISLAVKNMPADTNSPRSLLVIADSVSAADAQALEASPIPVQIWVPGTAQGGTLPEKYAGLGIDTRLNVPAFEALRNKGVPVTLVAADNSDLPAIISHVQQAISAQNNAREDLHWKNSGYLLVIPMLLILFFGRRQLFCLLVFALPAVLYSPHGDAAWLDSWISPDKQGQWAFERGDYTQAAEHFRDPMWRGIASYYAKDYTAAISAFRDAPPSPESLLWMGNSYAQQKMWREALTHYDQALSLRPDWKMAQSNRAKIAQILLQLRQKERERQSEQQGSDDYDPDEVTFDLKKDQGAKQKELMPVASANPQLDQWYENLTISPSELLENLYRADPQEAP